MFDPANIVYAFGVGILGSIWLHVIWRVCSPVVQKIVKDPDELVSDDKSVPREFIDQQNEDRNAN